VEAQLGPLGSLHKIVVHATGQIVLGVLAAQARVLGVLPETTGVEQELLLAEAFVVQGKGALLGRRGHELLLAVDLRSHLVWGCSARALS